MPNKINRARCRRGRFPVGTLRPFMGPRGWLRQTDISYPFTPRRSRSARELSILRKPRCSRFYSESQHLTRLDTRRPCPRSLHASFIKYGHIVPDVLTNIDNYQARWSHTNLSDFSVVAAYECIAVMDLQTLARSTPVLREIQFQQCSFYSRRLLEAAVVNVVSAWK